MAMQVASLFGVLSLDDRDFRGKLGEAKSEMSGLGQTFRGTAANVQSAGRFVLGAVGAVALGAGAASVALLGMAKDASVLEGIEEAFDGLVTSTGKSSKDMLRSLQEASAGMANQQELMLTYNKAAQLVSTTFANQLPDAMDELTKVASATGQDMGYLMDSLVTGVGRLSPMILDNLGIQVDLTQAYDDYAASLGKTADELTKTEKQSALMAQVMKKLEDNTASLPDVFGQTDTKMAQFESRMDNIRFAIGRGVLPIFDKLVTGANGISAALELLVTGDFTKSISDALGGAQEDSPIIAFLLGIRDAFSALQAGVPFFDVLANLIAEVASRADAYGDLPLLGFLQELHRIVVDFLKPIGDWINENVKLEDILLGLGIAVGSVVVPAILGIIGAIAPIILTIGALIGAVVLVRKAWEENFLGIRDFVTGQLIPRLQDFFSWLGGVWENTVKPGLEKLYKWFVEDALPAVRDFIVNEVQPKVEAFFSFLGRVWEDVVKPGLEKLYNWFVLEALPAIRDFIVNEVQPKVETFFDIIGGVWEVVSTGLGKLYDWFITDGLPLVQQVIEDVKKIWDDFQTSLSNLWNTVKPLVEPIVNWFRDTFQRIGEDFIKPVLDFISDLIEKAKETLELLRQIGGGGPQTATGLGTGGFTPTFGNTENFAGYRAGGGSVLGGSAYVVGENGPELFIPSTGGDVVPNQALGGARYEFAAGAIVIKANSEAEGRAAARGFDQEMNALMRARG
ncbi:MAG: hypothetical protein K8L99_18165 [Anaerolineae bacterium]|nr:hypothetical protein [Anaerolineae bacterium]